MKNKFFSRLIRAIKHPSKIALHIIEKNSRLFSDETYLKLRWYFLMGYRLPINNPQTFNEKLQWLKLYDRKDIYTTMVDKYEVKEYVSKIIGNEYIIPTIGVWDTVDEIDFDALPNQFVLKCTHDSGGLVICEDKGKLDIKKAKAKLRECLKFEYFWYGREWPYKNVKPRIIAEQYMVDESGYELKDYKFFCFNGCVKALFVATDRGKINEETKFDFFDENFNHLPFTNGHPNSTKCVMKPQSFDKMKELAALLSKNIPHLRVDFYDINGKVYFGELTFSHWSGMVPFEPEEWDYTFGSWIHLPGKVEN
nr:glycosyl transferase [Bacteroidales bacterium]